MDNKPNLKFVPQTEEEVGELNNALEIREPHTVLVRYRGRGYRGVNGRIDNQFSEAKELGDSPRKCNSSGDTNRVLWTRLAFGNRVYLGVGGKIVNVFANFSQITPGGLSSGLAQKTQDNDSDDGWPTILRFPHSNGFGGEEDYIYFAANGVCEGVPVTESESLDPLRAGLKEYFGAQDARHDRYYHGCQDLLDLKREGYLYQGKPAEVPREFELRLSGNDDAA